jgi:hypothetical protein
MTGLPDFWTSELQALLLDFRLFFRTSDSSSGLQALLLGF